MRPSRRISAIAAPAGDSWALYSRARRMKEAGEKIVTLTIGDHDWTTPETVIAAMAEAARAGHTGYSHMAGLPELRAALARREQARSGVPTGPGNILVTTGGQAALFAAMMAGLDPGDRALILSPYYPTYPETVRAAGAVPEELQTVSENGFEPTRAQLEAQAPGCRLMLVNSPHNPTGAVYSRETVEAIADVARAEDMWLVSDEVYAGQVHEGAHLSPRSLPGMAGRTLVIGSMSKSHVMTGFRIGWVCGPEEMIDRMEELSVTTTYGVPGFIQHAALHALREGDAIEAETAARYRRRRDLALKALEGANAIRLLPPKGGMYLMLDIRATGMTGKTFAEALLDQERIAVMPGESFGEAAAGHLRVALTCEDAALADAMRRIAAFAAQKAGAM